MCTLWSEKKKPLFFRVTVICFPVCREVWWVWLCWSAEHGPDQLHNQTADGTREGIPLQQVPDPGAPCRDCSRAATEWDSGENLVPEPEDEAEKARKRRAAASQTYILGQQSGENGRCSIREIYLSPIYSFSHILHCVFHGGWSFRLQLRVKWPLYLYRSRRPVYTKFHTSVSKAKIC